MTKEERQKAAVLAAYREQLGINTSERGAFIHGFEVGAEAAAESLTNEIRKAFAKYKKSEGCGCCRDDVAHLIAENKLGELLKAEKYSDNSGYNWNESTTP